MIRNLLFLAVLFVLGCGGGLQEAINDAGETARDLATIAEPCFNEQKKVGLARCGDDQKCQDDVMAVANAQADVLDAFNKLWCTVSPKSEGCGKPPPEAHKPEPAKEKPKEPTPPPDQGGVS